MRWHGVPDPIDRIPDPIDGIPKPIDRARAGDRSLSESDRWLSM